MKTLAILHAARGTTVGLLVEVTATIGLLTYDM